MINKLTNFTIITFLTLLIIGCGSSSSSNSSSTVTPSNPQPEPSSTSIETTKQAYTTEEAIIVNFNNMSGENHDWIAIYPSNVSSDWGNQLQWTWTEGDQDGQKQFNALPAGSYEVRAFFNNSFTVEATYPFKIDEKYNNEANVSLTLNKNEYAQNELIYIQYNNMQGNQTDWIGLFTKDSNTIIDSKQTNGSIKGELSLAGVDTLIDTVNTSGGLKAGDYEVKAFFNDSLTVEKLASFTVVNKPVVSTVYESVDNEISPNWYHISGPTAPYYNQGMVSLETNWINNFTNTSEYRLLFPQVNTTQKVLELDAGGIKESLHFYIGVILETTYGPRKMIWDPFFTHEGTKPFKNNQYLSYPLYVDIQREAETRHSVRVDVEKYLRILEPTNKVLSISAFMSSGGDLDEIRLSSH